MGHPLLEVKQVKKHFPVKGTIPFVPSRQSVKAVDNVNFHVMPGETLGIVGESGCGKSTLARLINRLISPTEGEMNFKNKDLVSLSKRDLRTVRKNIQMVFQDPYASLDPRKRVGQLIEEPLVIHGVGDSVSRKRRVAELLEIVGLNLAIKIAMRMNFQVASDSALTSLGR